MFVFCGWRQSCICCKTISTLPETNNSNTSTSNQGLKRHRSWIVKHGENGQLEIHDIDEPDDDHVYDNHHHQDNNANQSNSTTTNSTKTTTTTQIAPMQSNRPTSIEIVETVETKGVKCKLIGLRATHLNGRTGVRLHFHKSGESIGRFRVVLDGDLEPREGNFWPINLEVTEAPRSDPMSPSPFSKNEEVNNIHSEFNRHENNLKKEMDAQMNRSRRRTDVRLAARKKIKQTKAFSKVKMFAHLSEETIGTMVDKCAFKRWQEGDVICHQGDDADCLYVIAYGECKVMLQKSNIDSEQLVEKQEDIPPVVYFADGSMMDVEDAEDAETDNNGNGDEEKQKKDNVEMEEVCRLGGNDFFGESSLLGVGKLGIETKSKARNNKRIRNATIEVTSEMVDTLALSRTLFCSLLASGDLDDSVITNVENVGKKRKEINRLRSSIVQPQEKGGEGGEGEREGETKEIYVPPAPPRKVDGIKMNHNKSGEKLVLKNQIEKQEIKEKDLKTREMELKQMQEMHKTNEKKHLIKIKEHEEEVVKLKNERTKHQETLKEFEELKRKKQKEAKDVVKVQLKEIKEIEENGDGDVKFTPSFDVKSRLAAMKASRTGNSRMNFDASQFQATDAKKK